MTKTRETLLRLALATVAFGLSPQLSAGTLWDGGGADNDWLTADNWDPDGAPGTGSTVDLTFAGTTRLTSNNNYADWEDFRNLDFAAGAGAFTLTGANIDLFGRIENQSSSLQTISLTLAINAGQPKTGEFNPVEGDLLVNGANLFTNGNTIQVWGDNGHTLTFDTVIDGTGGLTVNQNSTVILAKDNTHSGANTVNAGTLQIGNGSATGNFGSGTMTLGAAGTLAFQRTGNFNLGGITTAAGSTVAVNLGTVTGTAATSFGSQAAGNLVTIGSGGAINLNGTNRAANTMDLTLAGSGVSSSGAIYNSGAALFANSGVRHVTLSGNATVASGGTGEGSRWDFRSDGTLTLNGHTLTKTGGGNLTIRSSVPLAASGTIRVAGGTVAFEDNFTGAITANYAIEVDGTGSYVGAYNARVLQSNVTLTNGGGIYSQGSNASTWNGTLTIGSGGGRINSGNVVYTGSQINIGGALDGSGPLTVQGPNWVVLGNTGSTGYTGKITVDGGSLRIAGDGALGAVPGAVTADAITLTNGGRIQGGTAAAGANVTIDTNRGITLGTGGGGFHVWSGFTLNYGGALSGSGAFNKTDGGALNLTGNLSGYAGTYAHQAGTTRFQTGANALTGTLTVTGGEASIQNTVANTWSAVNLNGGTLRILSNNNALGGATLAVGGNATLASENGSSALTLSNGATISGTNTLSIDAGYAAVTLNGNLTGSGTKVRTSSSGVTTLGGTVNMGSTALGNVSVESTGTLVLSSTANVTAGNVFNNNATGILTISGATVNTGTLRLSGNGTLNLNTGTVTAANVAMNNNSGVFNITGGTLNTQYINLGDGGSTSGRIVQTGGTVNVLSGGNGFRIGHWNNNANAGSSYNLSGGVLDATGLSANAGSARVVNIGWDGQGDMIVGGGAGSATLKSFGIQLDGNSNSGATSNAPSTGNMTLTVSTNGLVEVGAGNLAGASTLDTVILNGGTLRATENSTWSAAMVANASTTSTLQANDTFTATVSGDISGSGSLIKSGLGTVTFSTAKTLTGPIAVNEGRLLVSSTLRNTSGITVGPGATLETGATNMFVAGHGDAVANSRLITVNGGTWLMNGSMDSRIGNVTLSNGATWTSNRGLSNYDVLLGDTTTGAATVTVANTGGNTTGSVMNGTGGIHLQGIQNFDVADVTGSSAADLTVSMILGAQGSIGGAAGGINKTGGGTMAIATQATYTGGTTVNGGVLDLTGGGGAAGTLRGTATINNGGTLRLSIGDATGYGTGSDRLSVINVNAGGTLHLNTTANQTLGNAAINLTGGAITGVAGSNLDFFQGSSALNTLASATTATISGTKLTMRQNNGVTFNVADGAATHDLVVDSVIANASGFTDNHLTKTGAGTMVINATNTYTTETRILDGTLLVNGSIGSSNVTVGSAGALGGGSATAGVIGGNVTVDGTFTPGNSAGTLALGSDLLLTQTATLLWDIDASAPLTLGLGVNDLVTVGGDLTLDGVLNVAGTGSFSGVAAGTRWTLLTYGGTLIDNTLVLGAMPTLDAGSGWSLDTATAGEIGLVVIPEPKSALLGSLGLLLILRRRRC